MSTYNYNYDGNNHNWWEEIIYICIIIIITLILFSFSSCSSQRKIERAKQLVLTDSVTFRYIGRKFDELNPCINNILFKVDTTIQKDTLISIINKTDTVSHIDTVIKRIVYTNNITIHDTAIITDNKKIKLLTEDNNALNLQIANMNGQLSGQHDIIEQQSKKITQLNWRFYGSWGGLLFIVLGFFAVKIASKNNPTTVTANAGSNILTTIINKIKGK